MPSSSSSLAYRRKKLRQSIATLKPGSQRRYSDGLRSRIAEYAHERVLGGVSLTQISSELGVSHPTLVRQLEESKRRMRRVRVARAPVVGPEPNDPAVESEPEPKQLVVRGPGGIVIEGLDIEGAAALLRALS